MTHFNALYQEEYELIMTQIQQRLCLKILESQNQSLAVLRAKAWLSLNHQTPNNLVDFNHYKTKKMMEKKHVRR